MSSWILPDLNLTLISGQNSGTFGKSFIKTPLGRPIFKYKYRHNDNLNPDAFGSSPPASVE